MERCREADACRFRTLTGSEHHSRGRAPPRARPAPSPPSPMPRENLRARARRRALRRVASGDADDARRGMTRDELDYLIDACRKKYAARFGVVRLSSLDLDAPFATPERSARTLRWSAPRITLLQLAATMGRDAIVLQLLRAGASPVEMQTTRDGDDDANSASSSSDALLRSLARRARTHLQRLRSPHSTWVAKGAVRMRHRALLARDDAGDAGWDAVGRCERCGRGESSGAFYTLVPIRPRRRCER